VSGCAFPSGSCCCSLDSATSTCCHTGPTCGCFFTKCGTCSSTRLSTIFLAHRYLALILISFIQFGDLKLTISVAGQECQSRKIKCGIEPGDSSCVRCQKLGLHCVVNKSLQTLLEDESEWKVTMEQKTEQLQFAVSDILRQLNLPGLGHLTPRSRTTASPPPTEHRNEVRSPRARKAPPTVTMVREPSAGPDGTDEDVLAAAPMASLFEVTKLQNIRNNIQAALPNPQSKINLTNDFLSQGKISVNDAEELFHQFNISLNQYLWGGVALLHDNLTSVRESSPMLSAAILAVTALHIPGREHIFDLAYAEFLALVGESMFNTSHSLDDVRSLCIGAFWLSDVSCMC
jgi:hypothetical protein